MTERSHRTLIPRFLSVGGLGFLLDAGVFQALVMMGVAPIPSRVVSATLAITLTWYLNRHYVFETRDTSRSGPEYARYVIVQTVGLVVNFGIFLILVDSGTVFEAIPILALCGGALAAITFNYLGARYWAFRKE